MKTIWKQTPLLAVAALIVLSGIAATSLGAQPNKQSTTTMSCDMGNGTMSCNSSMMTTITGVLQHHGRQYSIGNIILTDGMCSCCSSPDSAVEPIHEALVHLVGQTITVTGMLDCSQPNTLMIYSINGVVYRSSCC